MEYEGLTSDDLANVRALNRAWLDTSGTGSRRLSELPPRRLERMAATPFLLFSLCEEDLALWERLLADDSQRDLFRGNAALPGGLRRLQATALAFLWALARRNPYVVRLISGAPLYWCERIASATLVEVTTAATRQQLAESRIQGDSPLYRRLMLPGGDFPREAREFAQIAALQSLLTGTGIARPVQLPAAACRMPRVAKRVADKL
jgi:hypothetical protein